MTKKSLEVEIEELLDEMHRLSREIQDGRSYLARLEDIKQDAVRKLARIKGMLKGL